MNGGIVWMKRGFEANKQFIRERFVSFVSSKFIHQCTTGTLLKQTVQFPLNASQFGSLPHNLFVCQSRSFVNWHPFGRKRDRLLGNFFRFKVIPEITPTGQPAKKPNIKHFLESLKVIRIVPEIKISKSARNGLLWFVGSVTIGWWLYRRYWAPKESRFRRKVHTLVTVAVILADYKYSLRREEHGTESYQLRLSEAHKRAASRLLALADANGGVYTKAGQFITSLNGIPIEYRQKLCKLEDQAESRPFKEIKSVILSEFSGKSLEDLFLYIEEVPIAAASLAQVHRGITRKGEPIAVKVQYPLTEKCFYSDLDNMSLSSRIVRFVFPQLDLDWIVKKFTAEIAKELDFEQEARNSQQLAKYFQGKPTIKVPFVYSHLSSKRVLTMELIEGVKITDVAQLKALGISPRKVVRSLYEIFGEMIFCHGFFHADPHPGNIMVQKREGPVNFRIVLLDHGLYRRLSPQFRQDFCELWKSLIPFNEARLFQISKRLGIHSHYQYFPLLISRNYWRSLKLVSLKELASLEVFNLVENVSEDMMLIIKSFVHLNYIASDLGVNAVEIARVLAKYAFKGDTLYAGWEEGRRSNLFVGYYTAKELTKYFVLLPITETIIFYSPNIPSNFGVLLIIKCLIAALITGSENHRLSREIAGVSGRFLYSFQNAPRKIRNSLEFLHHEFLIKPTGDTVQQYAAGAPNQGYRVIVTPPNNPASPSSSGNLKPWKPEKPAKEENRKPQPPPEKPKPIPRPPPPPPPKDYCNIGRG